jgi:hypothetical protein
MALRIACAQDKALEAADSSGTRQRPVWTQHVGYRAVPNVFDVIRRAAFLLVSLDVDQLLFIANLRSS